MTHVELVLIFFHWGIKIEENKIKISNQSQFKKTIGNNSDHNQSRFTRLVRFIELVLGEPFTSLIYSFNKTSRKSDLFLARLLTFRFLGCSKVSANLELCPIIFVIQFFSIIQLLIIDN